MTDTNFISSEPRNKSFDENIRLFNLETQVQKEHIHGQSGKICFNPYCNGQGTKLIRIIGTPDDYRDHRIPYCVCDECFLPFTGWGPGRDYNESLKSIPESKICYNRCCSNEGKHWIDIYKKEVVEINSEDEWLGLHMPYWICETCYAFFEVKRKDIAFLDSTIFHYKIEVNNELRKEENRTGITVGDFCNLLEPSRSYKESTKK